MESVSAAADVSVADQTEDVGAEGRVMMMTGCIYPSPPFVVGHDEAVKVPPPSITHLAVVSGVRVRSISLYFGPPVTSPCSMTAAPT